MLTSQQIVALACQTARVPGYVTQGGQLLNAILSELCQDYDFDVARTVTFFNFDPSLIVVIPGSNSIFGSGPYPLPADYLRADPEDIFYTINGVPYVLINLTLAEFDRQVQQAGIQNFPYWYATDMSTSPPGLYVYPPPSGQFPVTARYRRQMPDIVTPELSNTVPWFPNQNYLLTRLAGELMKSADDERKDDFLGDGPAGAQGILSRYLKLKDDKSARSQSVSLDRRRFGRGFANLPNTKTIGW